MHLSDIIASIIQIDKSSITEETSPAMVGQWTSMKQLALINSVESTYNVRFTISEMKKLNNVGAFLEVLRNKGVQDVFL